MRVLKPLFLAVFLLAALPFYAVCADENVMNVLCYHRFKERKPSEITNKQLGDIYSITPKRFEEHMQFLKDGGYAVIPMSQYVRVIEGKEKMPEKAVVISIDDGYRSIKDRAFPILKKFNFPAVLYVYSVFLPGGKNSLTPTEARELLSTGLIEFGSHSHTHPILTKRSDMTDEEYCAFLIKEIITSKRYLEKILGVSMETMGYPYGAYSKETNKVAEKAGFKAGFSVVPSYNTLETGKFSMKRTMIYNSTTVAQLKAILEKKPLKIEVVYPQDGDIITDAKPVLKAKLEEDAGINTATIRFEMGRVTLEDTVYDPGTKSISYTYDKPLPKGVHAATVKALDMQGLKHEYSWLFVVGKPIAAGVLEDALSKISVAKEK